MVWLLLSFFFHASFFRQDYKATACWVLVFKKLTEFMLLVLVMLILAVEGALLMRIKSEILLSHYYGGSMCMKQKFHHSANQPNKEIKLNGGQNQ